MDTHNISITIFFSARRRRKIFKIVLVKLTQRDIQNGNIESANERMNTGDGGLAKHNSVCEHPIMWNQARIVGKEQKLDQRKYLEGIMSLKEKSKGIIPLNAYNQMEPWQPTIYAFLDI